MKKFTYTHCNSDKDNYHIQTNNVRDPLVACFPTSMINWCKINKLNTVAPDDPRYEQLEDDYDAFLHEDEDVQNFTGDMSRTMPWVKDYLDKGGDPRELWDVEVYAMNKWLGEKHAKAQYNLTEQDIIYEIQSGRSIVTTGKFCGFSHAVTIVGFKATAEGYLLDKDIGLSGSNMSFQVDGKQFVLTDIIILDTYGNPNDNYANIGKGGFDVVIPKDDFFSCINKSGKTDSHIYYGITYI